MDFGVVVGGLGVIYCFQPLRFENGEFALAQMYLTLF
jgi:hypothetical protein